MEWWAVPMALTQLLATGKVTQKETDISGPPRPALCQQQHCLEERHFAHALCTQQALILNELAPLFCPVHLPLIECIFKWTPLCS